MSDAPWDCMECETNYAHKTCPHCKKSVHPWMRRTPSSPPSVPVAHLAIVCSWCNRYLRCDDKDAGISTDAVFNAGRVKVSHGICDGCLKTLFGGTANSRG